MWPKSTQSSFKVLYTIIMVIFSRYGLCSRQYSFSKTSYIGPVLWYKYIYFILVLLLWGVQLPGRSYKHLHHKHLSRRSFLAIWSSGARLLPVGELIIWTWFAIMHRNFHHQQYRNKNQLYNLKTLAFSPTWSTKSYVHGISDCYKVCICGFIFSSR